MTQKSNVLPFNVPGGSPTVATKPKVEPYGFTPEFERALVVLLCSRAKFNAMVCKYIDTEALASPLAKMAVQVTQAFVKEHGRGPDKAMIVIQRLRRWVTDGKITHQDVVAVSDYFDEAEDAGLPSEEDVLAELLPELRRREERDAIEASLDAFKKRGDVAAPMKRVEEVMLIGKVTHERGIVMGPASFDELERLKRIEKLPTGILELDDVLGGGVRRGSASMFLAGATAGKSMALIQVANAAAMAGFHVAYATLELPIADTFARLKANLVNIPVDAIIDEPKTCGADAALATIMQTYPFGSVVVRKFTPKITTMRTLDAWIKQEELERGVKIDVLVIDYGDKMGSGDKNAEVGGHVDVGNTYDQMFTWASKEDDPRWVWTASQSTRQKDKAKNKLVLDDVADAMGKVRHFDTVITLNPRDDYTQMIYGLEKNRRGGHRGAEVGPLPVDFAVARIAPTTW